jgi:hypothetical protein
MEAKYPFSVGTDVLAAVVMKSIIFLDMTQCSPLKINRRFGGVSLPYSGGRRTSRAKNQRESRWKAACRLLSCSFLLGLFFDPEDGGDMFLITSVDFQRATRRYMSEDSTLHPLSAL